MFRKWSQPVVIALTLTATLILCAADAKTSNAGDSNAYLGRWDLTLKAPDRDYPSWLELSEKDGKLVAQMVGRWGNARQGRGGGAYCFGLGRGSADAFYKCVERKTFGKKK